ncbi:MAG TPA: hypothetical protein VM432_02665 [Bdellovibrionales bacterium]|nr:hypothetical protein [Bdellovibrionales bacterium]
MSKIGSDGKSSSETLEGLKSLYAQRERDAESKHRTDISELQKTHQTEIERMKQESNTRIKAMQEETSQKLSQRDLQNQKEIDAMRAVFQKRATEAKKTT